MKQNSTNYGIYRPMTWLVLIIALVLISGVGYSQVAINNDNSAPDASAMLDVKATGMGLLAPRMTFAQRPAAPATGLLIYQTNASTGYYYYDGATWQKVGRASEQFWTQNGSDIYFNTGNVAIGNIDPEGYRLDAYHYNYAKAGVRGVSGNTSGLWAEGQLGLLNYIGNPLGLPVDVPNIGVFGFKPNSGLEGAGIYGWSMDTDINNYGGIFVADGSGTGTNNAIYAEADSAGTANYAGYFKGRVHVESNNESDGAGDHTQSVITAEVTHNISTDTYAVHGKSVPAPGYGYGVRGEGGYKGVYGWANATTYSYAVGVHGYASGTTGTRIGVYGQASGGTTNWGSYFIGSNYMSGDLRIGTTTIATGYALSVNGNIACEEVLVQDAGSWPDYVFNEDYDLMSLEELESNINKNNHLPGLPLASEVEANGFNVADMQKRVLEKVEELTLYTIEQGKLIQELQDEVKALKTENSSLKQ